MKVCIFGAGAVGGHIAARFAFAGNEVCVVARGAHLEAIQRGGLKLLHGDEVITGPVRAAEHATELGPQDFVFVTLKANLLGAFATGAGPLLGPRTAVVFVQNGIPWWYAKELTRLDPGEKLARAVERERVIGGVAYSANEVVEPGVVRNQVPGRNMLVVGEVERQQSGRISLLRTLLESSGLSSPPADDIRQSIWSKLSQNLGTSTLCTLMGATVGDVRAAAELGTLAARLGDEGRAIAQAYGISVEGAPQRPGGGHGSGIVAHKPSMLQDYERGRPMEVEAQLMAPLTLARAAGVPTPTLDVVVPLVARMAAAKGLYAP